MLQFIPDITLDTPIRGRVVQLLNEAQNLSPPCHCLAHALQAPHGPDGGKVLGLEYHILVR